jgi:multidrug resistance efflux pump
MAIRFFSPWTWSIAFVLLAASVAGTGLVFTSNAGNGNSPDNGQASASAAWSEGIVCMGHVDVEYGVRNLGLTQPGRVEEVRVHEGDVVKVGDVLLRVDDKPYRFLLRQAQADLEAAQATLDEANKAPKQHEHQVAQQRNAIEAVKQRVEAARQQVLAVQKAQKIVALGEQPQIAAAQALVRELRASLKIDEDKLTELELVDPHATIVRAEQDVRGKQARLANAQYAMEETALRAPFDGKVLRILVGPGEMLSAQPRQVAVQFAPMGPRLVRAEVEQEYAGRAHLGQRASVQDDSRSGPVWQGKVVRISDWYTQRRSILQEPLQVNDVRTLECIVQLDPSDVTPRIGQRVRVSLGETAGTIASSSAR